MPELTALVSPTINSYKRYVPGVWAPLNASWGVENRTCAIRAIPGSSKSTRLEYRQTAADINPYIAMAATLAAGLWGIENRKRAAAAGRRRRIGASGPRPASAQRCVRQPTLLDAQPATRASCSGERSSTTTSGRATGSAASTSGPSPNGSCALLRDRMIVLGIAAMSARRDVVLSDHDRLRQRLP